MVRREVHLHKASADWMHARSPRITAKGNSVATQIITYVEDGSECPCSTIAFVPIPEQSCG